MLFLTCESSHTHIQNIQLLYKIGIGFTSDTIKKKKSWLRKVDGFFQVKKKEEEEEITKTNKQTNSKSFPCWSCVSNSCLILKPLLFQLFQISNPGNCQN